MPTSGEVRINGAHVFINDIGVSSLSATPPAVVKRKDMNAAAPKPTSGRGAVKPGKAGLKRGAVKPGKPSAPPAKGQGALQSRAQMAHYWATHKAEYNKWASDNGKNHTDCGVFIGKVMRDSGSDPNYPTGWTGAQWEYVTDPKNGWTTGRVGDGGMQPGDVLLRKPYLRASGNTYGHTGLYSGVDPNDSKHVVTDEASLGGHGPKEDFNYTNSGLARTYEIWARPPSGK